MLSIRSHSPMVLHVEHTKGLLLDLRALKRRATKQEKNEDVEPAPAAGLGSEPEVYVCRAAA
jgi:hypothetical protein